MNTRDPLEDRIRHTLLTVAETVTETPAPQGAPAPTPPRTRRRKLRNWSLIGGAVAVPVMLAAGAYVQSGPEYVTTIPEDQIVVRGALDGDKYLLIEARNQDCRHHGVEFLEEDENLLGSEWNTIGANYGQAGGDDGCYAHNAKWLANPALYEDGGTEVGDSFVWLWAVHPDVTAVRITTDDGSEDLPIHTVDGAGYALYEIPEGVDEYTAELMIGDQVVPGATEEQVVPQR